MVGAVPPAVVPSVSGVQRGGLRSPLPLRGLTPLMGRSPDLSGGDPWRSRQSPNKRDSISTQRPVNVWEDGHEKNGDSVGWEGKPVEAAKDPLEDLCREESETLERHPRLRKVILRWAGSHEPSPEFEAAVVVPSLKFSDYRLEENYTEEFFRKRMRKRVATMALLAFILIICQVWFGVSKGMQSLRYSRSHAASTTTHSRTEVRPKMLAPPPSFRRILTIACPPVNELVLPPNTSPYVAACIDEAVVDGAVLIAWLASAHVQRLNSKMEAVNVILQLLRTGLIIFFAQGIWSPCAKSQGSGDVMINNLIVACANVTIFNFLALSRVRRGCFVSLAWLAGLIEVLIVMVRAEGGVGMAKQDAPQLALFFVIFLMLPVAALCTRFRAELVERELLFHEELITHCKLVNARLNEQLVDIETLRDVDIERALPEGVVPSQIVHVAVMELKLADRTIDTLHNSLPSFLIERLKVNPASTETDQSTAHHHRSGLRRFSTAPYMARESIGSKYDLETSNIPKHHDLAVGLASAHNVGLIMEASAEVKTRIQSALKLLARSHDFYSTRPLNDFQEAVLFHALGHDVRASTRAFQPSLSTLRQPSRRRAPGSSAGGAAMANSDISSAPFASEIPQIQQLPFLSGLGEIARNIGQSWMFDMLKVTRVTKDQSMLTTAMLLVSPIAEKFNPGFDWPRWYSFIRVVQSEYGPSDKIPYHNRTHASIHAHATSVILSWLDYLNSASPLESLAVLTASLCHDVGHPGRTNAYLVNASKRLAIVYNDIAVLENLHACKTFESLLVKDNNFLSTVSTEDYRFFRKIVIELILATDMKLHLELTNAFKLLRSASDFSPWDENNKLLTLKMVIKAADLSHGAFEWPIHQQLSMAVTEEFWAQGDAEEKMGLPKSPLCDRGKANELAKSQIGFLEFVVLPIFTELGHIDHSGHIGGSCEPLIRSNISKWRVMAGSHGAWREENSSHRGGNKVPPLKTGKAQGLSRPLITPEITEEKFPVTRINFDDE